MKKYTQEKELAEFFNSLNAREIDFKTPRFIPDKKTGTDSLAILVKDFKTEAEAQWQKYPFHFVECTDELRKTENIVGTVSQYFPREVKNAHSDYLNNASEVSDLLNWWLERVLPSYEVGVKKAYDWALFFFQPSDKDEWFYKFMCSITTFSKLPKRLRTKEFILQALVAHPSLAQRLVERGDKAGDFNMPVEIWHDKEVIKALIMGTMRNSTYRWLSEEDVSDTSDQLARLYRLDGLPVLEEMRASRQPFKVLAKYVELEKLPEELG